MVTAKFKVPKQETKVLWCGLYGGHYDVIVFFNEKPIKSKVENHYVEGDWYDMSEQEYACGSMCLGQFYELFPDVDIREYTQPRNSSDEIGGRPKEIEICEVFQIELTYFFDKYGKMESIQCDEDGWQ